MGAVELVLHALLSLVSMYATLRSPVIGIVTAAGIGSGVVLAGGARADWLPIIAGGLVMGLLARQRIAPRTVLWTAAMIAGTLGILVWTLGPSDMRAELMAALSAQAEALRLSEQGMTVEQLVDQLVMLMPAGTLLSVIMALSLSYAVGERLFPLLGVSIRSGEALASWTGPFWIVWSFAAGLTALAVGRAAGLEVLFAIGVNATFVHAALFFVLGIAVARHRLLSLGGPRWAQTVVLVTLAMVALLPPLLLVVAAVGLFDVWFDFRRLNRPEDGESAAGAV